MSPLGGSLHTRHTHLKQWPPCVHKACTLCLQLVQVVTSPCSLLPQQAHAGSADVGQKKDDMDVGELRGAEAADVGRGSAWGSSKENAQPLVVRPLLAARVTWVWKMSVLWVFK
uniref:Uncharacterized protein n=1 Tax=Eutreptiella gymnastica TaxID=73025 RepID=A0A7S4CU40_9EUGL